MAEGARQAKAAEPAPSPSRAVAPTRPQISRRALDNRVIQPSLRISQPSDAAEVEADRVAKAVVSMPDPGARASESSAPAIQRKPSVAPPAPTGSKLMPASPGMEAQVRAAATGGSPLPGKARAFLEPRFRTSFSGVSVHTDGKAAGLSAKMGAKAFTYGSDVFFGGGAYDHDSKGGMELIAHELTHTIQQGGAVQRKALPSETQVTQRTGPQASRLGLSDALNFFADAANAIPGYRMFTILIGMNPINGAGVEASAANILRAIVEFLPGGNVITRVLDSYGIFDRVGGWIEGQLKSLGISGASIKAALDKFMDSLSWKDIFNLGGVWNRAKAIFTEPIGKIISFAKSLFSEILRMVREAVLRPLAALAEGTAGYPLLKVIIGMDPVTGDAVEPTADNVIGGLMTLIGQDELWGNIQRARAIPRAWAWFKGAMGGLKALVTSIPDRFIAALKGLEIMDFVVLPSAFIKLAKVFGNFLGDFGSWALGTVIELAKIIVEVVAPGVMPYIAKAGAAFNTIVKNPVGFVQTLVAAALQGFNQFRSNFLTHLKASLIGWVTGALGGAGVYIPQGFSLIEIVKFVLSVLGLTWANVRAKLVRATNETTVKALETGFDLVKKLVTEGPAAMWQQIIQSLTNLKDMIISQAMDFVKSKIVEIAVTKLLSMLSPAGAIIQAILAIWNTIMFFKERISQIAAVAASFIDSIATIAAGNIGPAANKVEQTMAGMLTLVISFLARIAGLGKVSDAILDIVKKIRAPIDKGLDKAVAWVVAQAKKLGKFVLDKVKGKDKRTDAEKQRDLDKAVREIKPQVRGLFKKGPPGPLLRVRLMAWKLKYKLTDLTLGPNGDVRATINPTALIDQLAGIPSQQALNVIRLEIKAYFHRDRDPKLAAEVRRTGTGSRTNPLRPREAGPNPTQATRALLFSGVPQGETALTFGGHHNRDVNAIIRRPGPGTNPNVGEIHLLNQSTGVRGNLGPYARSGEVPGSGSPLILPPSHAGTIITAPFGGDSSLPVGYMGDLAHEGRISTRHSARAAEGAAAGLLVNTLEGVRADLGAVTIPAAMERTARRGDAGGSPLAITQGGPHAARGSARDYRLVEHALSQYDPVTGAKYPAGHPNIVADPSPKGVKKAASAGSEVRAAAQITASVEALSDTILQGMVVDGKVILTGPGDLQLIKLRTRDFLLRQYGPNP